MNGPLPNSYASNYINGFMMPYFILPKTIKENEKFIAMLNDTRFVNNLNRFCNLRVSSFEWSNLPETVEPTMLEILFLMYGTVGMHRTKDGDYICLGLIPYGKDGVSINGQPYNGYLYGYNGQLINAKLYQEGISQPIIRETVYHKLTDADYDTVMGRENYMGYSFFNQLWVKVWDLTQREKILNQNIQASAQPILITCQESEKESIKRELNKVDEGQYRIIAFNGAFNGDKYEVIDTGFKPEVINILAQEIQRLTDDIMNILGINSNGAMANKKERLIVDEVNANNQHTETEVEQALVFRKKFCQQCKDAFGLNIDCNFRYSTPEVEDYTGGEDDDMAEKDTENIQPVYDK